MLCICYVDLEKVFDNLDLWDILNLLLEIIFLIKDIYSNNFSHPRMQSELTEKVAITRGDSLSPLL